MDAIDRKMMRRRHRRRITTPGWKRIPSLLATVLGNHVPSRRAERSLVRALGERARKRGFATAEVSLREKALSSLNPKASE